LTPVSLFNLISIFYRSASSFPPSPWLSFLFRRYPSNRDSHFTSAISEIDCYQHALQIVYTLDCWVTPHFVGPSCDGQRSVTVCLAVTTVYLLTQRAVYGLFLGPVPDPLWLWFAEESWRCKNRADGKPRLYLVKYLFDLFPLVKAFIYSVCHCIGLNCSLNKFSRFL
jgi:hypothetical protein